MLSNGQQILLLVSVEDGAAEMGPRGEARMVLQSQEFFLAIVRVPQFYHSLMQSLDKNNVHIRFK